MTNSFFFSLQIYKKTPIYKEKKEHPNDKKTVTHAHSYKKKLANTKKNSYLCNRNKQKK